MSEPSQRAKDVIAKMQSALPIEIDILHIIQTALDAERAEALSEPLSERDAAVMAADKKDLEIALLKEQIRVADVAFQGLFERSKIRVAELEAWKESAMKVMPDFQAIGKALGIGLGEDVSPQILPRIQAMAALLDLVPHEYLDDQPPDKPLRCWTDCPACAWAKLKTES